MICFLNSLRNGRLDHKLADYTESYVNICCINSSRIEVNKICFVAFCKEKQHVKVKFNCNGGKEVYKVCDGTPMIFIYNIKDRKMFNLQQFTIKSININGVTIKKTIKSSLWITSERNLT